MTNQEIVKRIEVMVDHVEELKRHLRSQSSPFVRTQIETEIDGYNATIKQLRALLKERGYEPN